MNNNGHNYSVHKSVKVLDEQSSDIDGNYWVEGGMTAENAKSLAENLALIDRQTLGQLAMRELEVFYVVVNDDTHKAVCKYNMVEEE